MPSRRYTILIADRTTGLVRRCTLGLRPVIAVVFAIVGVPILLGLGAKRSASADVENLRKANARLEDENGNYRAATGELTTQIQSLEDVLNDLGARASLDPGQAQAIQRLPAVVKSRAAGGVT